jgi:molybdopterin synthase catalytic subunit
MRNHADGRDEVKKLTYEAYEEQAVVRMRAIAEEAQKSWTGIGRIAMIHRLGDLELGDSAVIVCVSSGHRPEAFEAARFCIDALKASVPIWKKEEWAGGSDWGTRSQDIGQVTSPTTESAR